MPFRLYAADRGKARWGDKRPGHVRHVDVLRALFPDAQVVHIVRDPRDCVGSLARMPWWSHGTEGALATWVHAVDCAAAAAAGCRPTRSTSCATRTWWPTRAARSTGLCAFLGEDFEEAMLDHREVAAELPQRQRERWHQETQGAVCSRRVGTYAGVLTPAEVALVESAAGSGWRGWATTSWASGPVPRGLRLGYRRAVTSLRLRTLLRSARDRQLARPAGSVAAAQLARTSGAGEGGVDVREDPGGGDADPGRLGGRWFLHPGGGLAPAGATPTYLLLTHGTSFAPRPDPVDALLYRRPEIVKRGRSGHGQDTVSSSSAETPVIRCTANDRTAPRRWSYALR